MKISLIIQCIDTFGFTPAKYKLRFYADDRRFYPVLKSGGYYIASSELPREFSLLIRSDAYHDREIPVSLEEGIIRAELIRKSPPPRETAVWFDFGERGRAALEYGYFCPGISVSSGDARIAVENPYRFCLEGRSFLLLDTNSGAEEFIVLEKAENALMTEYSTGAIGNGYNADFSVLLPAFDVYVKTSVPLKKPPSGEATARFYGENGKQAVRIRAYSLFS